MLRILGISELVNGRGAVLDEPELRGDRPPVAIGEPEAQRSGGPLLLRPGAHQRRRAFRRFPAGLVDPLIIPPRLAIEGVMDDDGEVGRFGAALSRVAEAWGAAMGSAAW